MIHRARRKLKRRQELREDKNNSYVFKSGLRKISIHIIKQPVLKRHVKKVRKDVMLWKDLVLMVAIGLSQNTHHYINTADQCFPLLIGYSMWILCHMMLKWESYSCSLILIDLCSLF